MSLRQTKIFWQVLFSLLPCFPEISPTLRHFSDPGGLHHLRYVQHWGQWMCIVKSSENASYNNHCYINFLHIFCSLLYSILLSPWEMHHFPDVSFDFSSAITNICFTIFHHLGEFYCKCFHDGPPKVIWLSAVAQGARVEEHGDWVLPHYFLALWPL